MVEKRRGGDRRLSTLFEDGTAGGLSDSELLERFARGPGDSAESAFQALVERHGPMVLQVGRRLLRDEADAHDVFQATFLILARKAKRLRSGPLGPWLHGVAFRVASCARAAEARRRRHERSAAGRSIGASFDQSPDDVATVLHEELGRLPERYRRPLVLCYLEGVTGEEAARRLDWPVGTVRSRLARGRDRLRDRLTRRGVTLSIGLEAVAPAISRSSGVVPPTVATGAVRGALEIAAGRASVAAVSTSAWELMKGAIAVMNLHSIRNAAVATMIPLGLIAACAVWFPGGPRGAGAASAQVPLAPAPAPAPAVADPRIAPLLGSWILTREYTGGTTLEFACVIRLMSADPNAARAVGFEAPFVCTFTEGEIGEPTGKAARLAFVDPGADPPRITYLPLACGASDSESPRDGVPGVYRIDGDEMVVHQSNGRSPRPVDFTPAEGNDSASVTGTRLERYRRAKPTTAVSTPSR